MSTEEKELVLQAATGNVDAFSHLIDIYSNAVYAVTFSKINDFHSAEDVAQEVFIKAWYNLSQLKDPEKFGSWILSISRNQANDWLRQSKLEQELFEDYPDLSKSTEDEFMQRETVQTVRTALNRLEEKYRLVAVMYFISGFNTREISKFLGISLSAVESRLKRSKNKLQKELFKLAEQTLESKKLGKAFTQKVVKRIVGMACIKMPVSNLERSVDWYVNHLGCILLIEPTKHKSAVIQFGKEGPEVLFFEQPDIMQLHFTRNGEAVPMFELRTEDINGFYAQLKAEGVRVAERYDNSCGKYFQVFDPDGMMITIIEWHAPA
jgi:RNA polymerase sigma-70 factor (ECF subfamily)